MQRSGDELIDGKEDEYAWLEEIDAPDVAITTADIVSKSVAVEFEVGGSGIRIEGMEKGSGMIHPNMGTLLGVDGDTSTNDTIIALASGLSGLNRISSLHSSEGNQLQMWLTRIALGDILLMEGGQPLPVDRAAASNYLKEAGDAHGTARAVLINAGQANAATGDAGYQDVIDCSYALSNAKNQKIGEKPLLSVSSFVQAARNNVLLEIYYKRLRGGQI
uniref:Uncharacterized protein n=1 Tax=Lactuca sativa TaxID=4236 RepID=A0A9R1W210_LACSA|nr:hypothetical protein LSAT_V11C400222400 [Lactuca sativa]